MARNVPIKGRMYPEDEERIQRCTTFIEDEVEAKDLTSFLYSAKILDIDDRREIDARDTRADRTRRLLEILIMRGRYSYHEFIKALKKAGYEHVVDQLESDDAEANVQRNVKTDRSTAEERFGRIEDLLNELFQRVIQLESRQVTDIPDREISTLKQQLSSLKTDTLSQIRDLIKENVLKDEKIADLTLKVGEKQNLLQQAEERIVELEDRIQELESQCNKYRTDIDGLKKQGAVQADKLQRQENRIHTQSLQLQKQDKKLGEQDRKLGEQEDKITQMSDQMNQMATTLSTVRNHMALDGKFRVIGRNVPQQERNRIKYKWN